jgi:riboflavin synthase
MFTGLVKTTGEISGLQERGDGMRVQITSDLDLSGVQRGDSIALDGVCLTVVGIDDRAWEADVSHETLRCTTLGGLKLGDRVHLEPALRAGEPLGGHLVQGHVDCTGRLRSRSERDGCWDLVYSLPPEHVLHVVEKGSIAVDGVSLTVNHCGEDCFGVTIIPHTEALTHLLERGVGEAVNLETDMVGKYVVSTLLRMKGALSGNMG